MREYLRRLEIRVVGDWLDFVERKIGTAVMLNDGQCNGSYSDACVLLSSLISGIAAELWPGEGIDRARFIELWIRYADPALRPDYISIPLLRRFLQRADRLRDVAEIEAVRSRMFGLGHGTRVLRGVDVDMNEAEVTALSTSITRAEMRRYAYPSVFYKHVRSNLVHEYKLSDDAATHFATRLEADVSYVNRHDPDSFELSRRLIHFHIEWLAKVARSIAANVAGLIDAYSTVPAPPKWWLQS